MQTSPTIAALAAALAKAQGEIEGATKDASNPAFRSKYATLASIWDACRAALSKNGIAVVQSPGTDDAGAVTMTTMLIHSSGQWMQGALAVKPMKPDAQGVGSVVTYLRRYALAAMVGVAPDDDDDGEAGVGRGNGGNAPGMAPARTVTAQRGTQKANGHVVPVPIDSEGSGSDWKSWAKRDFPTRLNHCKSAEEIQAVLDANAPALDTLKGVSTAAYDALHSMWTGRIEALVNGQAM